MPAHPCKVIMEGMRREAAGHEGRVVDADDGVEQYLFKSSVEIRLQNLGTRKKLSIGDHIWLKE